MAVLSNCVYHVLILHNNLKWMCLRCIITRLPRIYPIQIAPSKIYNKLCAHSWSFTLWVILEYFISNRTMLLKNIADWGPKPVTKLNGQITYLLSYFSQVSATMVVAIVRSNLVTRSATLLSPDSDKQLVWIEV